MGAEYTCCEVEQNGCIAKARTVCSIFVEKQHCKIEKAMPARLDPFPWHCRCLLSCPVPCWYAICPNRCPLWFAAPLSGPPLYIIAACWCFVRLSALYHSCLLEETQQRDSGYSTALTVRGKLLADERSAWVWGQIWHKDIQQELTRCKRLAYLHSELSSTLVESAW